jgi:hypothetical protein
MTPYTFTESEVEEAALAWFAGLGYLILSGPEIAPGEAGEERTDYRQPFLPRRIRNALRRINPALRRAPSMRPSANSPPPPPHRSSRTIIPSTAT